MLDSAEELAQVNKDSIQKAFHIALDWDDSDNDEVLDKNWVPKYDEINENKKIESKGKAGSDDLVTGAMLTEFYD